MSDATFKSYILKHLLIFNNWHVFSENFPRAPSSVFLSKLFQTIKEENHNGKNKNYQIKKIKVYNKKMKKTKVSHQQRFLLLASYNNRGVPVVSQW